MRSSGKAETRARPPRSSEEVGLFDSVSHEYPRSCFGLLPWDPTCPVALRRPEGPLRAPQGEASRRADRFRRQDGLSDRRPVEMAWMAALGRTHDSAERGTRTVPGTKKRAGAGGEGEKTRPRPLLFLRVAEVIRSLRRSDDKGAGPGTRHANAGTRGGRGNLRTRPHLTTACPRRAEGPSRRLSVRKARLASFESLPSTSSGQGPSRTSGPGPSARYSMRDSTIASRASAASSDKARNSMPISWGPSASSGPR